MIQTKRKKEVVPDIKKKMISQMNNNKIIILLKLLFLYFSNFFVIHLADRSFYAYAFEIHNALLVIKSPFELKELDFDIAVILCPVLKLFILLSIFYRINNWIVTFGLTALVLLYLYIYINPRGWLMITEDSAIYPILVTYVILVIMTFVKSWKKHRSTI